jgi:hypothetical protein
MDEHGDPTEDDPGAWAVVLDDEAGARARAAGVISPIADAPSYVQPEPTSSTSRAAVTVVPLDRFIATSEDVSDPLLGNPEDSLLPTDGLLLMYGDGGAGKTTLSIDAAAHLASGTDWIGITVPRPIRILLIENEGPRGPFRRRLAAKVNTWKGEPFAPNIVVLEEPWTHFTLADRGYRHELAEQIIIHDIDLVIVGPLASIGAKGGGTPDEITEFDGHVRDLRNHAVDRPFALWIVHHENKAGDVSGAWERYPDSLVHVQGQGNGLTKIVWRKVRWSSTLHGTSTSLAWTDDHGYTLIEKADRDLRVELLEHLANHDYRTLTEIASKEEGIGANKDKLRPILSRLVEDGLLEYAEGRHAGRSNANAKCWRTTGHTLPDLDELERLEEKHRDVVESLYTDEPDE